MKVIALSIAAIMTISGCATITRGKEDVLVVNSTPSAAQVKLSDGQACGSTPCTFKLPRKSEINVLVYKDRCQSQTVRVTNKLADGGAAGMAGNIVFGGLIGAAVDANNGATRDLTPNPVNVTLACRTR